MTPADEAQFIALWQQGLETAVIAQRLGIPPGTARSRAYTLQQQGKIQPRPRGGRRTPARQHGIPTPVQSSAERCGAEQNSAGQTTTALVPSPAVASAAIIDLLRQTLARLDTVEQDLKAIREDHQPAAPHRPVQGRAEQCRPSHTHPRGRSGGAPESVAAPWAQAAGGGGGEGPRPRPE